MILRNCKPSLGLWFSNLLLVWLDVWLMQSSDLFLPPWKVNRFGVENHHWFQHKDIHFVFLLCFCSFVPSLFLVYFFSCCVSIYFSFLLIVFQKFVILLFLVFTSRSFIFDSSGVLLSVFLFLVCLSTLDRWRLWLEIIQRNLPQSHDLLRLWEVLAVLHLVTISLSAPFFCWAKISRDYEAMVSSSVSASN